MGYFLYLTRHGLDTKDLAVFSAAREHTKLQIIFKMSH